MIDTTSGDATVMETRQLMNKTFDIDITINGETHNLEINVVHNELLDGSNTEFEYLTVGIYTIEKTDNLDLGEELHDNLDGWFGDNFTELTVKETEAEFDEIYSLVWEYIELKDLQ